MATKKPKKRATKKATRPSKAIRPQPRKPKKAKAKKATAARRRPPTVARAKPRKRAVVAKKAPAPAKPKKRAPAAKPFRRRQAEGRIDPTYGAELLARSGRPEPEGTSFLVGPRSGDDLAEELGEEFVETATSGEHEGEEAQDQVVPEESGGPFVVTSAGTEFARGTDASNPIDAKREPFPKT